MLVGVYTIPVLITYLGLISSLSSLIFIINHNYQFMIITFMLSGIFDLFDGMIARKLNKTEKENLFGIQIDSIIDVCSFGFVPIIIGYNLGMNSTLDFAILGLYLLCTTMRLAYFNYLALSENKENIKAKKFYHGLPVTYSTIILPLVYIIIYYFNKSFDINILRITYFLIAILFVLNVKLPKPKGIWYIIFPILTILASILTILVF